MHTRLATCALLVGLMTLPASAQTGLAFLRIGANASAAAMGDAQTANTRDAFSTYWNPAGLAGRIGNSVGLSHHIWIGSTRTYSAAGRFQAGEQSGFGVFVTAMDSGDLEARESPGAADGFFNAQFVSLGGSFAHAFGPLRLGVSAKFLSERIFTSSAEGYAFDFGAQTELFESGIKLGVALLHLGEMNTLSAEATDLPTTLRAGVAVYPFRVVTMTDNAVLLNAYFTGEVSHVLPTETTRLHVGAAVQVEDLVIIRAGYITNDELRGATIGGGIGTSGLLLDYAFVPFDGGFGGSGHVLSMQYAW
ncbi:MAG: PorV/PorQ family protein [Rhodothermales bacterium]